MARKKKHPEHENLERWLVSYADFITLLFATFVVLYALAQVDATDFAKLEESLKNAFAQSGNLFDGQQSVMDGSDSLFDQQQANSFIPSLMLEYISPKYEEESFKEIEESIQKLTEAGELDGISTKITDKGLLISTDYFDDDKARHLDIGIQYGLGAEFGNILLNLTGQYGFIPPFGNSNSKNLAYTLTLGYRF